MLTLEKREFLRFAPDRRATRPEDEGFRLGEQREARGTLLARVWCSQAPIRFQRASERKRGGGEEGERRRLRTSQDHRSSSRPRGGMWPRPQRPGRPRRGAASGHLEAYAAKLWKKALSQSLTSDGLFDGTFCAFYFALSFVCTRRSLR